MRARCSVRASSNATRSRRRNSARSSTRKARRSRPAPDREQRLYDLALDATWELDFFGRVRRSVQAATADANAATEALRDTFVIVSAELARTYFELKGARYRLSVAQRNAENQQADVRAHAGVARRRPRHRPRHRTRASAARNDAREHSAARDATSTTARIVLPCCSANRRRRSCKRSPPDAELPALPQVLDIGDPAGDAAQARRRALRGVRVASGNGARRRCDGRSVPARLAIGFRGVLYRNVGVGPRR